MVSCRFQAVGGCAGHAVCNNKNVAVIFLVFLDTCAIAVDLNVRGSQALFLEEIFRVVCPPEKTYPDGQEGAGPDLTQLLPERV